MAFREGGCSTVKASRPLPMCRHCASAGLARATKERIAGPSSELNAARNASLAILASSLVAFRGENRFRIGAGNFADRDPAESADERAD